MEKRSIKDFLHLYLGCECKHESIKSTVYKLVGVEHDNAAIIWREKSGRHVVAMASLKPILRPLSDMTEEEMKEILILHFGETSRDIAAQSIVSVKKKHEVKMASKYGTGIPYIVYNESGIPHSDGILSFSELNADQFTFLLSKHFDLFGLIDAGLAIDKTKPI